MSTPSAAKLVPGLSVFPKLLAAIIIINVVVVMAAVIGFAVLADHGRSGLASFVAVFTALATAVVLPIAAGVQAKRQGALGSARASALQIRRKSV